MCPINFQTKILQQYFGNNFSFIKDNKGLAQSLKEQNVAPDETLVSIDVTALFISISVPVALKLINRKFIEHRSK